MSSVLKRIFRKFLGFGSTKPQSNPAVLETPISKEIIVEELMVPRSDVRAIKSSDSLDQICKIFFETEHTRIPVYNDSLDDIQKFLHLKDLFKLVFTGEEFNLKKILRKLIITTPTSKILNVFNQMREKRVHIALVIDEYGGTKGILTIEDIIEKMLGQQIEDEYDDEIGDNILQNGSSYIMSGRTKMEVVKEKLQLLPLNIEEPNEYETITGFVTSKLGHIPQAGEKVQISPNVTCTVIEAGTRTVSKVKIDVTAEE